MKNNKAFTIVELVIVITIIAVLAAIIIPTFASLIRSANVSVDTQLIKNLNTALRADKPAGKHETMHDALRAATEYGYDVSKINASAVGNEILWDQTTDSFCYMKDSRIEYIPDTTMTMLSAGDYRLWKIYNAKSGTVPAIDDQVYSIYLTDDAVINSFDFKVGFDAGTKTGIVAVNYTYNPANDNDAHKEVIIRTNNYSTVLTIDAPKDTVYHFDKANKVIINSVAPLSYHESGDVLGNIVLKNGRAVIEKSGNANAIYVEATASEISSGTVVISADNSLNANVPIILSDEVKDAIDAKAGQNSIPDPAKMNVIVLSDKVLDDNGNKTSVDAVAYETGTKKNYATIQEALNVMSPGSTVILLKDVDNCGLLSFNKALDGKYKIDLNNHQITFNPNITSAKDDEMAFEIKGKGSYVICNGTMSAYSSEYGDVFETYCNTVLNNVTINIKNEPTDLGNDEHGARWGAIYTGAKEMVLNNCIINAISGPGIQNGDDGSMLIINDSRIISADHSALYCGGGSITEVNNSVVEGRIAVHACNSGAMYYLNSGTFTGTYRVIQLDNSKESHDYLGDPNYVGGSFAFVYGGTYNGDVYVNAYNNGVASLYVYGGTFTADVSEYKK